MSKVGVNVDVVLRKPSISAARFPDRSLGNGIGMKKTKLLKNKPTVPVIMKEHITQCKYLLFSDIGALRILKEPGQWEISFLNSLWN